MSKKGSMAVLGIALLALCLSAATLFLTQSSILIQANETTTEFYASGS